MCIVGDKEVSDKTVSVRKRREGDIGKKELEKFMKSIQKESIGRT